MTAQSGDRIDSHQAALLRELVAAWLTAEAGRRERIGGPIGGDRALLEHPGFGGRQLEVETDALRALAAEGMIRLFFKNGGCELEPTREGLDAVRSATTAPGDPDPPRRIGFETPPPAPKRPT